MILCPMGIPMIFEKQMPWLFGVHNLGCVNIELACLATPLKLFGPYSIFFTFNVPC
jgi:hypothetical protein